MGALDKIAELHENTDDWCSVCRTTWPCPTRRLCDEAQPEPHDEAYTIGVAQGIRHERPIIEALTTDLAAARADAERLAAALLDVLKRRTSPEDWQKEAYAAMAAHAALCVNGFAIEDLCDSDD